MPLGIKRVRKPKSQKKEMDSRKAAVRLIQFEEGLHSDKKRKRKKDEKAIVNDSKNGDTSDLEFIDSESELNATAKVDLQDTDADTVPFKKRKKNESTCDISSPKSEIIENKKKLRIKTLKKSKSTKIKSIQKNKSITDKNIKHKTKKAIIRDVQTSDDINQCTSTSIFSEKIPLKKIKKSVIKKTMLKNKHQQTSLKNVNSNLIL